MSDGHICMAVARCTSQVPRDLYKTRSPLNTDPKQHFGGFNPRFQFYHLQVELDHIVLYIGGKILDCQFIYCKKRQNENT